MRGDLLVASSRSSAAAERVQDRVDRGDGSRELRVAGIDRVPGRRARARRTRPRNAGTPVVAVSRGAERPAEPDQALSDVGHLRERGPRHATPVVDVVDAPKEVREVEAAEECVPGAASAPSTHAVTISRASSCCRAVDLERAVGEPDACKRGGEVGDRVTGAQREVPARAGDSTGPVPLGERGLDRGVDLLAGLERTGECFNPVDLATDGLRAAAG